ncbi:MAG: hypothetical protein LBT37_03510 [Lactobacillaceae bacterium]|nr:hypothetical protein [Lactobacillaceae bacterium]
MSEKLQLAQTFQSGMLLQRDVENVIWGTGMPQTSVTVQVDSLAPIEAVVTTDGEWELKLPTQAAGGPHQIVVKDEETQISLTNVLYGDVWLLAGQSNMQLWMGRVKARFPEELKNADNSQIRRFKVPQTVDFVNERTDLVGGQWQSVNQDSIADISALGYFFAQKIHADEGVPVGLMETAIGGTPIGSWLSDEEVQRLQAQTLDYEQLRDHDYILQVEQTEATRDAIYWATMDEADQGLQEGWWNGQTNLNDDNTNNASESANPSADNQDWQPTSLTSAWQSPYRDSGVTWLQKTFQIPAELVGTDAEIRLGTMTDGDEVYINGQKVGETGYMYPPRNYEIGPLPQELRVVIRLKICYGNGGLTRGKAHVLVNSDNEVIYDLDQHGPWQIRRGTRRMPDKIEQTFFQNKPSGLFNGMIAPLQKLAVKGFLYYQGESNDKAPKGYGQKLQALITDWRKRFGQGGQPWINVQLPNFALTPELDWVQIRSEQMAALDLPDVALVGTLDIGEYNDLHPTDKKTVGQRVALAAEKLAYQRDVVASGPLAKEALLAGQEIVVVFDDVAPLKQTADIEVELVTDTQILKAVAIIYDQQLRIQIPQGQVVTHVRYAWHVNPTASLYNVFDLPALPFDLAVQC